MSKKSFICARLPNRHEPPAPHILLETCSPDIEQSPSSSLSPPFQLNITLVKEVNLIKGAWHMEAVQ